MAALHAFGATSGLVVLAGRGFGPARLLLVPAGTRLPPGVHAVGAVPATAVITSVGSGSRAMGLVARAAAGADHGALTRSNADGALGLLSMDDAGSLASLFVDDVTKAGGLSSLCIDDSTAAAAAAGGRTGGSAGGGALLFLGGNASAGLSVGISSAALAGRRASSRGGRLVMSATAGSEANGGVDDGSTSKGAFVLVDFITTQGLDALWVMDEIAPPTVRAELAGKFAGVKTGLLRAVLQARQDNSDKASSALQIVEGWFGVVELARAAYPSDGLPPLPEKETFVNLCFSPADDMVILGQAVGPLLAALQGSKLLGPGVPESDAALIKSVYVAASVSQAAARSARASYVSGDPEF